VRTDKNTIRIEYLAARERVAAPYAGWAAEVCAGALPPLVPAGAIIGGYAPFKGELDVRPAMALLSARGHPICLPVIETPEKPLYFRKWRPGEALEKGRYGIAIPPAEAPVSRPEVLLVPLVAFDRQGHRLGYGAGYYDRTIARLREQGRVLVVGMGYARQEVARLPAAAWP
jgi:5-formyltetrahydrofolate cyclo-ligase